MTAEQLTTQPFSQFISSWHQEQVSGQLDVQVGNRPAWTLFFSMGRLIWARGGEHSLRRWRRLLSQHMSQLPLQENQYFEAALLENRDYEQISEWVRQQQISGEQAANLIRATITEVLFDILQYEQMASLSFRETYGSSLEASLTLLNVEQILGHVQVHWGVWTKAGLTKISPNFAPVLRQPEQLQQAVSAQVYQVFVKVINGQRTLRDAAMLMKQEPVTLVRTLAPYLKTKTIELTQLPDLTPSVQVRKSAPSGNSLGGSNSAKKLPLVVSVDDSFLERQTMERILTQAGYAFLGIEDAVQALPLLIQHKPAFIFLDLVMPVVNGYELCSQIRKISQFQDIPIVILTGNDGIVDRVRAKMVGANDFLGKPIDRQRVLEVLQRHLVSSPPESSSG
jgi:two-component system, chemotaxis family, response regulator PixG